MTYNFDNQNPAHREFERLKDFLSTTLFVEEPELHAAAEEVLRVYCRANAEYFHDEQVCDELTRAFGQVLIAGNNYEAGRILFALDRPMFEYYKASFLRNNTLMVGGVYYYSEQISNLLRNFETNFERIETGEIVRNALRATAREAAARVQQ